MDQHRRGSQSAGKRPAEPPSVAEIINSGDPFAVLGPHEVGPGPDQKRALLRRRFRCSSLARIAFAAGPSQDGKGDRAHEIRQPVPIPVDENFLSGDHV